MVAEDLLPGGLPLNITKMEGLTGVQKLFSKVSSHSFGDFDIAMLTILALKTQRSVCFCLPRFWTKEVHHHIQLYLT